MPDKKPKNVYLIGIGGIGVSALAQWHKSEGNKVAGSDAARSVITDALKKRGIPVTINPKSGKNITKNTDLVVYSSAVPASHPERKKAKTLGIRQKTYAAALGELTKRYKTVAVCGTHGKSTVTAMTALVLTRAKFDPTVVAGTRIPQFGMSNFRKGKSEWLVIEADEYRAAFLNYQPYAIVATNVEADHLDFYKTLANVKKAFRKFFRNVREDGFLVLNKEDKFLRGIASNLSAQAGKVFHFSAGTARAKEISRHLRVPGRHNLSNAAAADKLAEVLGVPKKTRDRALREFKGTWRRLELRGYLNVRGQMSRVRCPVFDDYAHHPTEIKATLTALKEKFPKKKIICVFQPHQAHRLKSLFKEFVSAFDLANYLILTPVYQVAGRDKPHKGYSSADLARKIELRNLKLKIKNSVVYTPYPNRLRSFIHNSKFIIHDSVIVTMGAGNITELAGELIS